MRRTLRSAIAAALLAAQPAFAFMIAPAGEEPGDYVVVIEAALGDHVPLAALPPPYNRLGGPAWPDGGLSFEWRYFRSPERGRAVLVFDEDERAAMAFEFHGEPLADGDTIAAAAALVDARGAPIRTLYAAARVVDGAFGNGTTLHRSSAPVEEPPQGWEEVAGFTFFAMKYYAIQNLDEDGVARAMRRAVERVTGGGGAENWALPAD